MFGSGSVWFVQFVCVNSETGRPTPASYVRTRSSPLQGDRVSALAQRGCGGSWQLRLHLPSVLYRKRSVLANFRILTLLLTVDFQSAFYPFVSLEFD